MRRHTHQPTISQCFLTIAIGVILIFGEIPTAAIVTASIALQPDTQEDATQRALAIRTAERLLEQAERVTADPQAQAQIIARAREIITPYLIDPEQDDLKIWQATARLALLEKDDSLAAFAFEAIARLQPNYTQNEELLNLMADLNARPIADKVKAIPSERTALHTWITMSGTDTIGSSAMTPAGYSYANGKGVPKNDAEAVRWFRKAAAGGDASAMYNLGVMYADGEGVAEDDAEAVRWYRKATEGGDAEAMFNLGVMYENGRGVAQDDAEALRWWRKAAEGGDATAMYNLGGMYADGRGVAEDHAAAVRWWRKAAEGGNASAMLNLGVMYDNGQGVAEDDAAAVRWYRKAAEGGDAGAMFNLGVMYDNGRGVPQDDAEALRWYRKAAEGGDATAMYNLGVRYANGRGVPGMMPKRCGGTARRRRGDTQVRCTTSAICIALAMVFHRMTAKQ